MNLVGLKQPAPSHSSRFARWELLVNPGNQGCVRSGQRQSGSEVKASSRRVGRLPAGDYPECGTGRGSASLFANRGR